MNPPPHSNDPSHAPARVLDAHASTGSASDSSSASARQRPPRQSRTGLTSTGARKAASKPARSRSREFALQALYQHIVGGNDTASIDHFTRELAGFHKCDALHYDTLLNGCVQEAADLDALIAPKLDRKLGEISPVERVCMWIGTYELIHAKDVPWRVVLNEAIELAKEFGGTDGHRYVNGVLNALAPALRGAEVAQDRAAHTGSAPAPTAQSHPGAPSAELAAPL